jgi:hypothetical protein
VLLEDAHSRLCCRQSLAMSTQCCGHHAKAPAGLSQALVLRPVFTKSRRPQYNLLLSSRCELTTSAVPVRAPLSQRVPAHSGSRCSARCHASAPAKVRHTSHFDKSKWTNFASTARYLFAWLQFDWHVRRFNSGCLRTDTSHRLDTCVPHHLQVGTCASVLSILRALCD